MYTLVNNVGKVTEWVINAYFMEYKRGWQKPTSRVAQCSTLCACTNVLTNEKQKLSVTQEIHKLLACLCLIECTAKIRGGGY